MTDRKKLVDALHAYARDDDARVTKGTPIYYFERAKKLREAADALAQTDKIVRVPKTPTLAMLEAGWTICASNGKPIPSLMKLADGRYQAMLSAASQPPSAQEPRK